MGPRRSQREDRSRDTKNIKGFCQPLRLWGRWSSWLTYSKAKGHRPHAARVAGSNPARPTRTRLGALSLAKDCYCSLPSALKDSTKTARGISQQVSECGEDDTDNDIYHEMVARIDRRDPHAEGEQKHGESVGFAHFP